MSYNLFERYPNVAKQLSNCLFPIGMEPVYRNSSTTRSLKECEGYYAVIDRETDYLFTIVSSSYKLVTNSEMVCLGLELAKSLFTYFDDSNAVVIKRQLSRNRGNCTIVIGRDIETFQPLINNGWKTIIKMQNSYNKTKSLGYSIGFYNTEIDNYITFDSNDETRITIKDPHSKSLDSIWDDAFIDNDDVLHNIQMIETAFAEKLLKLAGFQVSEYMLPVICRILSYKKPKAGDTNATYIRSSIAYLEYTLEIYQKKYGVTALTILFSCMDYGHSMYSLNRHLNSKSINSLLGEWVDEFIDAIDKPDFSMYEYIGKDAFDAAYWYESNK